jgi:hypothetical protein
MTIVVYVHGLESSGARRREQLTNTLYEFGFTSYKPTRMSGCDPQASEWGRLRGVCVRLCG